jgi:hypothetical protein
MQKPKGNELLTRYGKVMNPLNVTSESVNILEVVHALCYQPMFGGHMRAFYSKAEHCCNIFDYMKHDMENYLSKVKGQKVQDLKRNQILLYCLMYYSGEAYLTGIIGKFTSYKDHNPRLIGAVLSSLGEDFCDFKLCLPSIEAAHKDVCEDMFERYTDLPDRHNFLPPYEILKKYVSKINEVAPFEIQIRDGQAFIQKNVCESTGQYAIDFNLPHLCWG